MQKNNTTENPQIPEPEIVTPMRKVGWFISPILKTLAVFWVFIFFLAFSPTMAVIFLAGLIFVTTRKKQQ